MLADLLSHRGVIAVLYTATVTSGVVWLALQWQVSLRSKGEPLTPDSNDGKWWWLRWCAMIAFVGAWAIVTVRSARGVPFRVPSMTLLVTSVGIACLQWLNIWFVAWPGLRHGTSGARTRAVAALRWNAAMTVPVVFFFFAAEFMTQFGGGGRWVPAPYWVGTALAYGAVQGLTLALPRATSACLAKWPVRLVVGGALLGTLALM